MNRKALDVQKEPPMMDPLQAMAQLCEIRGDIPGALSARREELDCVLRDIERLERSLK
jgi:hypothetical protein